jgi:hypothetical protein
VSRYDDLAGAFSRMTRRTAIDEQEHRTFIGKFVRDLREYAGVPEDAFRWLPLDPSKNPETSGSVEAVGLQDDGWYHARFQIVLPSGAVTFLLRIRRNGTDEWWIARGVGEPSVRLDPTAEDQRTAFYDRFFDDAIKQLEDYEEARPPGPIRIGY